MAISVVLLDLTVKVKAWIGPILGLYMCRVASYVECLTLPLHLFVPKHC